MEKLSINIEYPINEPEKYKITSNVKQDRIKDLLLEALRGEMGKGADKRKAKEQDVYHITVEVDLSYDKFTFKSDTGNDGLTDGIIMDVVGRIK